MGFFLSSHAGRTVYPDVCYWEALIKYGMKKPGTEKSVPGAPDMILPSILIATSIGQPSLY